ncbi:hypothetical protein GCM10009120_29530 [Sphingobacterium siyangense subsp. cladoniae]
MALISNCIATKSVVLNLINKHSEIITLKIEINYKVPLRVTVNMDKAIKNIRTILHYKELKRSKIKSQSLNTMRS